MYLKCPPVNTGTNTTYTGWSRNECHVSCHQHTRTHTHTHAHTRTHMRVTTIFYRLFPGLFNFFFFQTNHEELEVKYINATCTQFLMGASWDHVSPVYTQH
uniref:Uncharacterized protein n=1 Tax=Octopus bimaculoides TaxID=37653 RepID=A0A0L8I1E0_OCTBM